MIVYTPEVSDSPRKWWLEDCEGNSSGAMLKLQGGNHPGTLRKSNGV